MALLEYHCPNLVRHRIDSELGRQCFCLSAVIELLRGLAAPLCWAFHRGALRVGWLESRNIFVLRTVKLAGL